MKRPALALVVSFLLLVTHAPGHGGPQRIDRAIPQRKPLKVGDSSRARMLGALTGTRITVRLRETPARAAFASLQAMLGISIVGRYSSDRIGHGIDPDTPITLDVIDQPALTALRLVLDQCQELDPCTWQLRAGFLEVGTKKRLSLPGARETRYYPIRDLLFEPPVFANAPALDIATALNQTGSFGGGAGRGGGGGLGGGGAGGRGGGGGGGGTIFDGPTEEPPRPDELERAQDIIELIVRSIEPEAWDVNGGDWATVRYHAGVLIVHAPGFIHRQIGGAR
jgi:uncharacterized membrane protein YgcG